MPAYLIGEDSRTWGQPLLPDDHPPDLIGIKPRKVGDIFSRLVAENAVHLFKCGLGHFTKRDDQIGLKVYYDSDIMTITLVLTLFLASLIPVASIWTLMSSHSLTSQLITVAAFNVLTSACLAFRTNANKKDIFIATAVLTTVQVLFVGNGSGSWSG